MAEPKRTNKEQELVRDLKKKNADLKKRLQKAEADSEWYRKAWQSAEINQITIAQLKEWDKPVEDTGRTILDVIREAKRQRISKKRA